MMCDVADGVADDDADCNNAYITSFSINACSMLRLVLGYTSLMIHLGGVGTGNGYFEWREPWANHYK